MHSSRIESFFIITHQRMESLLVGTVVKGRTVWGKDRESDREEAAASVGICSHRILFH